MLDALYAAVLSILSHKATGCHPHQNKPFLKWKKARLRFPLLRLPSMLSIKSLRSYLFYNPYYNMERRTKGLNFLYILEKSPNSLALLRTFYTNECQNSHLKEKVRNLRLYTFNGHAKENKNKTKKYTCASLAEIGGVLKKRAAWGGKTREVEFLAYLRVR